MATQTRSVATEVAVGDKSEFKTYQETLKDGRLKNLPLDDPFGKLVVRDDDSAYALVIRKAFADKKPEKTTQAFREVIQSYATVPSDITNSVKLESPFQMLIHHWDDMDEYNVPHQTELCRPGNILYKQVGSRPWLLVCDKMAYDENQCDGPYLGVQCTHTDHNGVMGGEATHRVQILRREFFAGDNPMNIADLPIYLQSVAKETGGDLKDLLKSRNEKVRGAARAVHHGLRRPRRVPQGASFDPAMESRVHRALTYSPPEAKIRRCIWTQYLSTTLRRETEINRDSAVARWPK
ncbi:hypothetical protein DL767_006712 [Monosporascus sp. MG133]|nr:hypothetical protein DL767_006712 [Monosporascus sp. MG133]